MLLCRLSKEHDARAGTAGGAIRAAAHAQPRSTAVVGVSQPQQFPTAQKRAGRAGGGIPAAARTLLPCAVLLRWALG